MPSSAPRNARATPRRCCHRTWPAVGGGAAQDPGLRETGASWSRLAHPAAILAAAQEAAPRARQRRPRGCARAGGRRSRPRPGTSGPGLLGLRVPAHQIGDRGDLEDVERAGVRALEVQVLQRLPQADPGGALHASNDPRAHVAPRVLQGLARERPVGRGRAAQVRVEDRRGNPRPQGLASSSGNSGPRDVRRRPRAGPPGPSSR